MNATRLPSKAFRSLRTILLSERMSICRTIWHARMIRERFSFALERDAVGARGGYRLGCNDRLELVLRDKTLW